MVSRRFRIWARILAVLAEIFGSGSLGMGRFTLLEVFVDLLAVVLRPLDVEAEGDFEVAFAFDSLPGTTLGARFFFVVAPEVFVF